MKKFIFYPVFIAVMVLLVTSFGKDRSSAETSYTRNILSDTTFTVIKSQGQAKSGTGIFCWDFSKYKLVQH